LSTYDDDEYIAQSIKAGAKGYLLKDMPSKELAEAIRLVHRGYAQLAPGLLERMFASAAKDTDVKPVESTPKELVDFSSRELEIVRLIGKGASNREIAQQLFITESTVKSHMTHIFNRLNLKNRAQVAIYANSVLGA
jgi:DNA-binding NarL/FixJ family response regulator